MDLLQRRLEELKNFWAGMSASRRFGLLAGVAATGVLVAALVALRASEEYHVLFNNLSPEESGEITSKLEAKAIPYKLDAGGSAVLVPAERLARIRVELAADGLPLQGGKGFELFDESSLGTTPFVQNVNYTRALQAELARSIMQLEPVQQARVLIARSEPTPFIRDREPTTASVVLKLHPGSALNRGTAAGIVSLVSRSVEGLKPENVTLVDSAGRMLTDPRGLSGDLPAGQIEYQRELEQYLSDKAEQMLARHLGLGRAVVRVSADLDFQRVTERRESVVPEERAVISERVVSSKTIGRSGPPSGIAGTGSNITTAALVSTSAGGDTQEEQIDTEFAVTRYVREMEDKMGGVRGLSIAAMIDLTIPDADEDGEPSARTWISLDQAESIIKQSIGFKEGRDQITVTNVSLAGGISLTDADAQVARIGTIQDYVGIARNVLLTLGMLVVVAMIVLALRRRPLVRADEIGPSAADEGAALRRFRELANSDPRRIADILSALLAGAAKG